MAIFTRRVLQRCIDGSVAYASDKARRIWVKKLNSTSEPAYIATEWEVVLLHAISQVCSLRHEPQLGGSSLLDIVIATNELSFGADIMTVSDKGLHERNPVHALEARLKKVYVAAALHSGGLMFSVLDLSSATGKLPQGHSILPPESEFDTLIFNQSFDNWLYSLRLNPDQPSMYHVLYKNPLSRISFRYLPGRRGAGLAEHTNYRATRVVNQNPLYNALTSKTKQLKDSGFRGPLGLLVCDGGADVLRENFSGGINTDQVVFEFMRRHTSVNFVVVLMLKNINLQSIRQRIEPKIFVVREEPWHKNLSDFVFKVANHLLQVIRDADNAISDLRFWGGKKQPHLGALTVTYGRTTIRELRMSTRTLLDVLAGRVSQKRLNQHYGRGTEQSVFEHLIRSGLLIESSRVERKPDEDDDEIVFTFGLPDPASSAFRIPLKRAD